MEVTGTAVTYNREATLPAASFYDVATPDQGATNPTDLEAEVWPCTTRRSRLPGVGVNAA
jgi:hypothetical protein